MFKTYMDDALEEAAKALERGEVPVGAVIVEKSGTIIARAGNETRERLDPSAHAEVLAIRKACDVLKTERLVNCDIYVTLEPCAMCAGAMIHARVQTLVFAAREPRAGAIRSQQRFFESDYLNHRVAVREGILAEESAGLLRAFFRQRRKSSGVA